VIEGEKKKNVFLNTIDRRKKKFREEEFKLSLS